MNKFLIIGHGRHGKDTLAEFWEKKFGMTFHSSSYEACKRFIFDIMKVQHGYETPADCYADRFNHRQLWYELIGEYNILDKARLAKDILEYNDCYVGMRSPLELMACKDQGLFKLIIWVDASERLPAEPIQSMGIQKHMADIVIENNLTETHFLTKALALGNVIFKT